jgi:glycerophosphoryl diester phosphodiesterase
MHFRTAALLLATSLLLPLPARATEPSPFTAAGAGRAPVLLAHRGVAQTFPSEGLTNDTCTAARIDPPRHALLENTIPSLRAAIAAGADVVEVDIHPTTDGEFAVFHDWTLECRTDGRGRTRDHSMAALKALDIGHGYTHDGGKTYPFRGRGVGLMPSLREVLAAFPRQAILLNVKSNDAVEGERLAAWLLTLAPEQRRYLAVYGGNAPVAVVRERVPDLLTTSRAQLKACGWRYLALGWSGWVPESCRRTLLLLPLNYANWLWGWPVQLVQRMEQAGSAVFVMGPYGGTFSQGLDTREQLEQLPRGFRGGIWTDEIQWLGKAVGRPAPAGKP